MERLLIDEVDKKSSENLAVEKMNSAYLAIVRLRSEIRNLQKAIRDKEDLCRNSLAEIKEAEKDLKVEDLNMQIFDS